MKTTYQNSFTYQVERSIEALPGSIILRRDVAFLGSKRQVTYALNNLIKQKKIARVSHGIYVKIKVSPYLPDLLLFRGIRGFSTMTKAILNRLNIPWEPSEAEEEYNTGMSTQVPANSVLRIKKRFRRKIAFQKMVFEFKKAS